MTDRRRMRGPEATLTEHDRRILQLEKRGVGGGGGNTVVVAEGGFNPDPQGPAIVVSNLPEPDGGVAPDAVIPTPAPYLIAHKNVDGGTSDPIIRYSTGYAEIARSTAPAIVGSTNWLHRAASGRLYAVAGVVRRVDPTTLNPLWTSAIISNFSALAAVEVSSTVVQVLYFRTTSPQSIRTVAYDIATGAVVQQSLTYTDTSLGLLFADGDFASVVPDTAADTVTVRRYRPDIAAGGIASVLLYTTTFGLNNATFNAARESFAVDTDGNIWVAGRHTTLPGNNNGQGVLYKVNGATGGYLGSVQLESFFGPGNANDDNHIVEFLTSHGGRIYALMRSVFDSQQMGIYSLDEAGNSIAYNGDIPGISYDRIAVPSTGHVVAYRINAPTQPFVHFDGALQRINRQLNNGTPRAVETRAIQ
jgi:hypothetical protein